MDEYFDAEGNLVDVASLELGDVVYDADGEAFELELDDEDAEEFEEAGELATVGKSASFENPFEVRAQETASVSSLRDAFSKAMTDDARDEVISKALDLIGEQEAIAKAAAATAETERQMRLDREYTEIAKSYSVGIDPSVLGPVLKRAAESLSYEDCEVLSKALQSGSAATEELFEEIGKRGGGANSDVFNTVEAYLDETISKTADGASRAEQVSKVFEENPNAYDEYLAEQRQGR